MKIDNLYQLYKQLENIIQQREGMTAPLRISVNGSQCGLDQDNITMKVIKDHSYVEYVILCITSEVN